MVQIHFIDSWQSVLHIEHPHRVWPFSVQTKWPCSIVWACEDSQPIQKAGTAIIKAERLTTSLQCTCLKIRAILNRSMSIKCIFWHLCLSCRVLMFFKSWKSPLNWKMATSAMEKLFRNTLDRMGFKFTSLHKTNWVRATAYETSETWLNIVTRLQRHDWKLCA